MQWLRDFPDARLCELCCIPGAHHSATAADGGNLLDPKRLVWNLYCQTQSMTVKQQLQAGVRMLDLRVEKEPPFAVAHRFRHPCDEA
ncbi:unnamed protein product, partial [Amoebophrya sp. A25]|eukprot:GSA25T00010488001.1